MEVRFFQGHVSNNAVTAWSLMSLSISSHMTQQSYFWAFIWREL